MRRFNAGQIQAAGDGAGEAVGGKDAGGGGGGLGREDAIVRAARAIGDTLAGVVTDGGFPTTVREAGGKSVSGVSGVDVSKSKREERLQRIKASTQRVIVAWALASACLLGHAAHLLGPAAPWLKVFCSTPVHAGRGLHSSTSKLNLSLFLTKLPNASHQKCFHQSCSAF